MRSHNVERAPFHASMVDELVHAVLEGHEHRSSGVDGRWALEMIMGMYESHRHGSAGLPATSSADPSARTLAERDRHANPREAKHRLETPLAGTCPLMNGPVLRVAVVGHTNRGNFGHAMDTAFSRVPGTESSR